MFQETVLNAKHYTDNLFSFKITRPDGFRFRSGEFVMIGLEGDNGKPLLRAYSIASPSWESELEFFSIKVPDGPLTSKLQHIQPGDKVILGKKPTGTLVTDALIPGKRLYLLSTGTGVAPFASLIRDPEVYEKFDKIILTHTCRTVQELQYSRELVEEIKADEDLKELIGDKLVYFSSATREEYEHKGRITNLIENEYFFNAIGEPGPFTPEEDRVMICGSMEMLNDLKKICEDNGLEEGANNKPGHFVIEKAFAG